MREWNLTGYIFKNNIDGIERIKIVFNKNEYEMQSCYFEPILQKFSLRVNQEMNPGFDYLSRFEEMERVMKLQSNSTAEQDLKDENEELKERIRLLEEGIEIMRKVVNDVHMIKEPIIFDGV